MSINHELYTHYRYCRRPKRSGRLVAAGLVILLAAAAVTAIKLGALTDIWPFGSTSAGTGSTLSAPYPQATLDAAVLTPHEVGTTFRPTAFVGTLWANAHVDGCPAFNDFWVDPTPLPPLPGAVESTTAFAATNGTVVEEDLAAAPSGPELWTTGIASLHCPPTIRVVRTNGETATLHVDSVAGPEGAQIRRLVGVSTAGKPYTLFVAVGRINEKAVLAMVYVSSGRTSAGTFVTMLSAALTKARRHLAA